MPETLENDALPAPGRSRLANFAPSLSIRQSGLIGHSDRQLPIRVLRGFRVVRDSSSCRGEASYASYASYESSGSSRSPGCMTWRMTIS